MRGCGDAGMRNEAVIPSAWSESKDLHLRFLTESTEKSGAVLCVLCALCEKHQAQAIRPFREIVVPDPRSVVEQHWQRSIPLIQCPRHFVPTTPVKIPSSWRRHHAPMRRFVSRSVNQYRHRTVRTSAGGE